MLQLKGWFTTDPAATVLEKLKKKNGLFPIFLQKYQVIKETDFHVDSETRFKLGKCKENDEISVIKTKYLQTEYIDQDVYLFVGKIKQKEKMYEVFGCYEIKNARYIAFYQAEEENPKPNILTRIFCTSKDTKSSVSTGETSNTLYQLAIGVLKENLESESYDSKVSTLDSILVKGVDSLVTETNKADLKSGMVIYAKRLIAVYSHFGIYSSKKFEKSENEITFHTNSLPASKEHPISISINGKEIYSNVQRKKAFVFRSPKKETGTIVIKIRVNGDDLIKRVNLEDGYHFKIGMVGDELEFEQLTHKYFNWVFHLTGIDAYDSTLQHTTLDEFIQESNGIYMRQNTGLYDPKNTLKRTQEFYLHKVVFDYGMIINCESLATYFCTGKLSTLQIETIAINLTKYTGLNLGSVISAIGKAAPWVLKLCNITLKGSSSIIFRFGGLFIEPVLAIFHLIIACFDIFLELYNHSKNGVKLTPSLFLSICLKSIGKQSPHMIILTLSFFCSVCCVVFMPEFPFIGIIVAIAGAILSMIVYLLQLPIGTLIDVVKEKMNNLTLHEFKFLKEDISDWSTSTVCEWMRYHDFSKKVIDKFQKNEMNGNRLMHFNFTSYELEPMEILKIESTILNLTLSNQVFDDSKSIEDWRNLDLLCWLHEKKYDEIVLLGFLRSQLTGKNVVKLTGEQMKNSVDIRLNDAMNIVSNLQEQIETMVNIEKEEVSTDTETMVNIEKEEMIEIFNVENWLSDINMMQYKDNFVNNGMSTIQRLKRIDMSLLTRMNIVSVKDSMILLDEILEL
eukprot:gene8650-597_t